MEIWSLVTGAGGEGPGGTAWNLPLSNDNALPFLAVVLGGHLTGQP